MVQNDKDLFEQIGLALDVYSNYEKFLLAGDFYVQEEDDSLKEFLDEFNAKNLEKDKTCFKSLDNPSCIDLIITNSYQSFQKTTTVYTGLSDFHQMVITVLKTTFPKAEPKVLSYMDFSKFVEDEFHRDMREKLSNILKGEYISFERAFLDVLSHHAPWKQKGLRANNKPYVTKQLRKAIMHRSYLENKHYKYRTPVHWQANKKQNNYCNRLYKRERKRYYSNLNLSNITDNKKFWNTVKPLFSVKLRGKENIVLVNGDKILSDDLEVAQTFNDFFKHSVNALNIQENQLLLTQTNHKLNSVKGAIDPKVPKPS